MNHDHHTHTDWDDPATWERELKREPALAPTTDALLDAVHAGPGQRLLDLACGLGHTTAAATKRGAHALGIDISQARIATARTRHPHARFTIADASQPPPGPWDAIVCRLGAHHLPENWADAAHAALAAGGRIAIAEWPPRDERDKQNGMKPATHWQNALKKAGFEDVEIETFTSSLPSWKPSEHGVEHDGPLDEREVLIISGRKSGSARA